MKRSNVRGAIALVLASAALGWSGMARAQNNVLVQPQQAQPPPPAPAPTTVVEQPAPAVVAQPPPLIVNGQAPAGDHSEWRPNRGLFMSGLVAGGVPYIASIVVAATSGHPGDRDLWIPVVGPYIDVGDRGGCPASGGCGTETLDKGILIVDGIIQSVGALEILGAFIFPESVRVTTVSSSSGAGVTFVPARVGDRGAYGLAAIGRF
jgi:hypothetical protein